jgi:predicted ATPase
MQQGLAAYEAACGKLWCPRLFGLLAGALMKAERVEEGLAVIQKALTLAELNGETYAMPELLRVKGELILKNRDLSRTKNLPTTVGSNVSIEVAAQACFSEAMAIARQQQTRSWELRVSLSMAANSHSIA